MRRLILSLIVVLVLPWAADAACTGASPRWASSADQSSLCGCIKGATPGDTIIVTGNETWTTGCEFTRGVHLVGVGNPTITGKVSMFYWNFNAAAMTAHDVLSVVGFTLDGDNGTDVQLGYKGLIQLGYSAAADYVTAIILDNTFKNTTSKAVGLKGRVHGVAARNTIDRVYIPFGLYGGEQISWDKDTQAYGDANQFYFEDNLIQYSSSWPGSTRAVAGGNGGQGVIRYNDWNMRKDGTYGDELWELHGLQPMAKSDGSACTLASPPNCDPTYPSCYSYSILSAEWYGNDTYNVKTGNEWMQVRGGWNLFFNNRYAAVTGSTYGIRYAQYSCDGCQQYTAYGPFVMHIANTYIWNNFDQGTRKVMTKRDDYCADYAIGFPYTITEDRDYWNDKYATFNGTSGVGCGTLAARPATCTTGVGYWATNQSCTDLTGMVGRNPSTPISGTLYKCTDTNTWTSYYTPYTYPHPLTVAPAAPTSARVK